MEQKQANPAGRGVEIKKKPQQQGHRHIRNIKNGREAEVWLHYMGVINPPKVMHQAEQQQNVGKQRASISASPKVITLEGRQRGGEQDGGIGVMLV